MSEAIDKAFEQALVRSMGGEDPVESAKLVHVASLAYTQHERVRVALFAEDARWQALQDEMFSKNISDSSQRWLDAKAVHDLLIENYNGQLKLLRAIGNPRGFTMV